MKVEDAFGKPKNCTIKLIFIISFLFMDNIICPPYHNLIKIVIYKLISTSVRMIHAGKMSFVQIHTEAMNVRVRMDILKFLSWVVWM